VCSQDGQSKREMHRVARFTPSIRFRRATLTSSPKLDKIPNRAATETSAERSTSKSGNCQREPGWKTTGDVAEMMRFRTLPTQARFANRQARVVANVLRNLGHQALSAMGTYEIASYRYELSGSDRGAASLIQRPFPWLLSRQVIVVIGWRKVQGMIDEHAVGNGFFPARVIGL